VKEVDLALLVLRVGFGLSLAAHGYNKFFGPGGLKGTTGWFGSIGMKWPKWQARLAATTEIGAGVLVALGLLTPLAAGAMIALMIVAIVVAHRNNGFFVFRPGQGWEYCFAIAVAALAIGTIGGRKYSLDNAFDIDDHIQGWTGMIITLIAGIGGAALQLGLSYRPPKPVAAEAATNRA
jgi:putative oxidoreductase